MPVSEETYQRLALEDAEGQWELVCGRLRQKPEMANAHSGPIYRLNVALVRALDPDTFIVSMNTARLRIPGGRYYIPDLCVLPRAYFERNRRTAPDRLEVYDDPVLLVVEVWSPSLVCGDPYIPAEAGDYDVDEKLQEYQRRGDAEIWRIHPYDKTLTTCCRQPGGSYTETLLRQGTIQPVELLNVSIDIPSLFD